MPRFYFSVCDGVDLTDNEGTELPDLEAVRRHASVVARELMHHRDGMLGEPWGGWTMQVTNEKGEEVLSFPFADGVDEARHADPR